MLRIFFSTSRLALLAGITVALPAQGSEYDGTWQFALSCAANGAQPAFTERFVAPVARNVVTRNRSGRTPSGLEDSSRFSGRIDGTQMTASLERTRGAERWSIRFAGPAISDRRFDMAGGIFAGERQLRSCQLVAEALTPAPASLAATAPARAEATRAQLATTRAELAALQSNATNEADTLRTALDLARFEGASMRTELTERAAAAAAQRTALEARLAAAEAATIQAQAGQAQALAAAAAEIGLRDQRLSAAAQQREALDARIAAAEAAATQQRGALEARIAAGESGLAQARAELETTRRELTEARAAVPPR